LTKQFKALDIDGTGLISPEEIKKYMEDHKISVGEDDIQELIKELDYAGNG